MGFADNKIQGTKRLYTDGKFSTKDGKAFFMAAPWRGLQAAGKAEREIIREHPFLDALRS